MSSNLENFSAIFDKLPGRQKECQILLDLLGDVRLSKFNFKVRQANFDLFLGRATAFQHLHPRQLSNG